MDSLQQMSGSRHEYRLKTWQRVFFLILGVAVIAGGAFLAVKIAPELDGALLAAIMMLFPLLGLYIFAWALRSRLVIDGTRIEVRGALKEYTAELSQIEGFRTISSRNGDYIVLYLKEGRGKITLAQSFATGDDYRAWFQQLTDLDARDRDALLAEIAQDAELGATPEDRLAALKRAKTLSYVAIAVSLAVAIGVNFAPVVYRLPLAAVLALTPVAVLMLMQRSPLLYSFFKKKADPRADVAFILMITSFGMAFTAADIEFVSIKPLLYLIIPVALVYIAALYSTASKNNPVIATILGLLFVSLPYSFGLAVVVNSMADRSKPDTYEVPVTGKHTESGKSTTYYLELSPWGPLNEPNNLSVSSAMYTDTAAGDAVCLALHSGRLHAQWYQLTDCPAEGAPNSTQAAPTQAAPAHTQAAP
jgi:hypothetical protein